MATRYPFSVQQSLLRVLSSVARVAGFNDTWVVALSWRLFCGDGLFSLLGGCEVLFGYMDSEVFNGGCDSEDLFSCQRYTVWQCSERSCPHQVKCFCVGDAMCERLIVLCLCFEQVLPFHPSLFRSCCYCTFDFGYGGVNVRDVKRAKHLPPLC